MDYQEIQDYLVSLVPPRETEVQAMEDYAADKGFPIVGPASAQFCYQIARMVGARRIFELGSGYGYSTAWFAKAVQENGGGQVHHVVWDETLSQMARKHLTTLGYGDIVQYHVNEAVQTLRQTEGPFDLIFNDIDKHAYAESLPVIEEKLRPGGVLIIDNMLWSGQVYRDDEQELSADTQGIREATRLLTTDPKWIVSLLPLRDGIMMGVFWGANREKRRRILFDSCHKNPPLPNGKNGTSLTNPE